MKLKGKSVYYWRKSTKTLLFALHLQSLVYKKVYKEGFNEFIKALDQVRESRRKEKSLLYISLAKTIHRITVNAVYIWKYSMFLKLKTHILPTNKTSFKKLKKEDFTHSQHFSHAHFVHFYISPGNSPRSSKQIPKLPQKQVNLHGILSHSILSSIKGDSSNISHIAELDKEELIDEMKFEAAIKIQEKWKKSKEKKQLLHYIDKLNKQNI